MFAPHRPIVVTPGEPAGIGLDLVLKLLSSKHRRATPLVIITDRQVLLERAALLNIDVAIPDYKDSLEVHPPVSLLHIPFKAKTQPGITNPENALSILQTIKRATEGCLKEEFRALVTGPINKATINAAGIPFTGHTEFLAELTKTEQPVMLLANDALKVAVATTHLPLKEVASALSQEQLMRCLSILHHDLKARWGINNPRILVCGLNPHAGEAGHLGQEEITLIEPVIKACQEKGLSITGPCPADTAFTPEKRQTADAVLAMYHDQGLPIIKALGFGETINVTLGLPIIRTSVDHGTALDLAGTGQANENSLLAAIKLADQLSLASVTA